MIALTPAVAAVLAAATIDVRVLTQEHPTFLTVDGPRHVAAAVIGNELRVDGDTVSVPFALPPARWTIRGPNRPPRTYEGAITLAAEDGEVAVVIRMERERYVALAVAGETSPGTSPAALEAQAIVARSWAAAAPRRHPDADVCDLAHCQVLRGSVPHAHLAASERAALATRGVVLALASGDVAMAPFHAACGGRTADPREVFGAEDRTGAESVEDAGCEGPRWHATVPREVVERAAAETLHAGAGGADPPVQLEDLALSAGRGGWVRAVTDAASGRSAFGDAFVRALGRAAGWNVVRGGRFRMTPDASRGVVIDGAGLGHGVGLCQTGAARLAAAGETARAILHHYFPRATPVVRADGSIGNLEASSE
jgi:stage II sporulation protein D